MLVSKLLAISLLPFILAKGPGGHDGGDGGDGATDGDDPTDTDGDSTPAVTGASNSSSSTGGVGSGISGNTTGLTGDSQCVAGLMCISAVVNGSEVEYVLQSTGGSKLGWMAMGFGAQMPNTPMVIMWENSDGSITLSQRQAPAQVMPTVVASPPRLATLSQTLSSVSGSQPKFGYTIPANSDTKQNIIWAFGTTNPGSSAVDATLMQHLDSGTATLDLTKAISSGSSPGSPASSTSGSGPAGSMSGGSVVKIPLLPYQKLIIAHAVVMTFGFLLLLPAGALLARYLRTFTPRWFKGHWIMQFAIGGPTIIIGIALGISAVHSAGALHLNDTHKKWGVIIFALYVFQCSLGAIIHFVKPKNAKRRPLQNYLHAVLGLTVIGLAFYQVRSGYKTEWVLSTGRDELPETVNIVWYIWVVLLPVLYTVGLFLLPKQFNQERPARLPQFDDSESHYSAESGSRYEESRHVSDPYADDVSLNRPEMQQRPRIDTY